MDAVVDTYVIPRCSYSSSRDMSAYIATELTPLKSLKKVVGKKYQLL